METNWLFVLDQLLKQTLYMFHCMPVRFLFGGLSRKIPSSSVPRINDPALNRVVQAVMYSMLYQSISDLMLCTQSHIRSSFSHELVGVRGLGYYMYMPAT